MRSLALIVFAVAVTIPALAFRLSGEILGPLTTSIVFSVAILGAACLLSWGAEAIQVDISQGLAIALLAMVTVLPEYAVDLYFVWEAGKQPEYAAYAIANMTGANRLLIGIGWSVVVFVFWLKTRRTVLELDPKQSVELATLGIAAIYGLVLFFKGSIHWIDSIVLIPLFALYMWAHSKEDVDEPELFGPGAAISNLPRVSRQVVTGFMFVYAAVVILSSAERFANGLVSTGKSLGIDEFILVQWVAPLASESPEIIVASMFALKGNPITGIKAIMSATVNQWTLLIGTIPLVYSISVGSLSGLAMDSRQAGEVLLTAAQAIAAVVLISKLRISVGSVVLLCLLFLTQAAFPASWVRALYTGIYFSIAFALVAFGSETRWAIGRLVTQMLPGENKNRGGGI